MMSRPGILLVTTILLTLANGCDSGFDAYTRLNSLRVLAIRAEPPTVGPGQSLALDALVYNPLDEPVSYAWSWCPLRGGLSMDYACAISSGEFGEMLGGSSGPPVSFDYDLGTSEAVAFPHQLSPEIITTICSTPLGPQQQDVSGLLDCSQGLPLSIGLEINAGDQQVTAFKEIYLALSEAEATNQNPSLGSLYITESGDPRVDGVELLDGVVDYAARFGESYAVSVDVPPVGAELYSATSAATGEPQETREILTLTWFVEAGEMDSERTGFVDGAVGLEVLQDNTWNMPSAAEYDGEGSLVTLVLRDDRGGVTWMSRAVSLDRR